MGCWMLVDERGVPFEKDGEFAPGKVHFALMRSLLDEAKKASPLFPSKVSELRQVVKEVTGYEVPGQSDTIRFELSINPPVVYGA